MRRIRLAPLAGIAGLLLGSAGGIAVAEGEGSVTPIYPRTTKHENGVVETSLQNGMRLLLKSQPDDPLVATMIWYAVGSRDEDVGETGLSHYLEHMLFKGTDRRPKGAIDKETQKNGGSNNASTRNDAT